MKVVVDTNILISALISPNNPPNLILEAWLDGRFQLITSNEQLEEIRRVSRYEHLRPFLIPHLVGQLLNRIRIFAIIASTSQLIEQESADPDDNFLIAICESSQANCLITGDHKAGLLQRRHIGITEVLTAAQFIERYLD